MSQPQKLVSPYGTATVYKQSLLKSFHGGFMTTQTPDRIALYNVLNSTT